MTGTEQEIIALHQQVAALRGKPTVTRRQWAQRLGAGPRDKADYLDGQPFPFEPADYIEDHR